MSEENQTIIRALNKYGRIPEQWELLNEIERLEQGYCELKEKCNKGECDCTHEEYNNMCEQNMKMDLEIERLNNIINELEKELDRGYRDLFEHELVPGRELITNIKNYLQELKGVDKE